MGQQFFSGLPLADLPWYLWERLERGVFATFLGVIIDPVDCQLSIVAVGDSCVAWYGNSGKDFYPPLEIGDFTGRTLALGYHLGRPPDLSKLTVHQQSLPLEPGVTHLFLMTDALAAWYRRTDSEGGQPWQMFLERDQQDTFLAWVELLRAQGELQDDDITLLALRVECLNDRVRA